MKKNYKKIFGQIIIKIHKNYYKTHKNYNKITFLIEDRSLLLLITYRLSRTLE